MTESQTIRVVVIRDGDKYVAQCLEYDISAQGSTIDEMQRRFSLTLQAELDYSLREHGKPFANLDRAPQYFFERWDACLTKATLDDSLHGRGVDVSLALCA